MTTSDAFLLRLRKQDTSVGVSAATLNQLVEQTGLTKTEIAHLAIREFANRRLPKYELDDGPLTPAQLVKIRQVSTATSTLEEAFTQKLFD